MGVNLLRQLPHSGAFCPLLPFIAVLRLFLSLGLILWVLRQWNLISTPEWGGVRKTNSIHCGHPTLHKPELSGLKDHWSSRVLNIFKSYIVVDLFIRIQCLLQVSEFFVTSEDKAHSLGKFNFSLV